MRAFAPARARMEQVGRLCACLGTRGCSVAKLVKKVIACAALLGGCAWRARLRAMNRVYVRRPAEEIATRKCAVLFCRGGEGTRVAVF